MTILSIVLATLHDTFIMSIHIIMGLDSMLQNLVFHGSLGQEEDLLLLHILHLYLLFGIHLEGDSPLARGTTEGFEVFGGATSPIIVLFASDDYSTKGRSHRPSWRGIQIQFSEEAVLLQNGNEYIGFEGWHRFLAFVDFILFDPPNQITVLILLLLDVIPRSRYDEVDTLPIPRPRGSNREVCSFLSERCWWSVSHPMMRGVVSVFVLGWHQVYGIGFEEWNAPCDVYENVALYWWGMI